jgi:DNA modification methylase
LLAEWDAALLDDWGVDISALWEENISQVGEENREAKEDDFDEGKDAIPALVSFGDIWKLGEHRLMCGDSTDAGSVALLMDGEKADMVFTDPPYNVNIIGGANRFANDGEKAKGLTILNDNFSSDEEAGEKLWYPAFSNMRENANDRCAIYVTMPQGGTHMMMMMMIAKAGWQVKHELIWKKQSLVLGRQDYNYQHEPICYGWNKTHNFVGGGKYATTSVWEFDRPTKSKEHPTMKPLELIGECLLDNSREGEIVLDVFGGSGSTMMACEQLDRKCYMMELDPHYCDVIIARWEKLTGKKAEKIS